MGYNKGMGKIYQQTFMATYIKMAHTIVAQAKFYDRKNLTVAADIDLVTGRCPSMSS